MRTIGIAFCGVLGMSGLASTIVACGSGGEATNQATPPHKIEPDIHQAAKCSFALPAAPTHGSDTTGWVAGSERCYYEVTGNVQVADAAVKEPDFSTSQVFDHCADDIGIAGAKVTFNAKHTDSISVTVAAAVEYSTEVNGEVNLEVAKIGGKSGLKVSGSISGTVSNSTEQSGTVEFNDTAGQPHKKWQIDVTKYGKDETNDITIKERYKATYAWGPIAGRTYYTQAWVWKDGTTSMDTNTQYSTDVTTAPDAPASTNWSTSTISVKGRNNILNLKVDTKTTVLTCPCPTAGFNVFDPAPCTGDGGTIDSGLIVYDGPTTSCTYDAVTNSDKLYDNAATSEAAKEACPAVTGL